MTMELPIARSKISLSKNDLIIHPDHHHMQLTEKQIINILYDRFTPMDLVITRSMNLQADLGLDSLDIMELVVVLETEFNIIISDQESDEIRTVDGIIRLIYEKIQR